MEGEIKYAVVKRTATVEVWVPMDSYLHSHKTGKAGQQMTEQEIREYELSYTGEDSFQALAEAASVAREENIDQSCTVTFTTGPEEKADV